MLPPTTQSFGKKRKLNEFDDGTFFAANQHHSSRMTKNRWGDSNSPEDRAYGKFGGVGGTIGSRSYGNSSKVEVSRSALNTQMKSKLDIYNILAKEGQYYLPPISECPMDFIKDILTAKKKVS